MVWEQIETDPKGAAEETGAGTVRWEGRMSPWPRFGTEIWKWRRREKERGRARVLHKVSRQEKRESHGGAAGQPCSCPCILLCRLGPIRHRRTAPTAPLQLSTGSSPHSTALGLGSGATALLHFVFHFFVPLLQVGLAFCTLPWAMLEGLASWRGAQHLPAFALYL